MTKMVKETTRKKSIKNQIKIAKKLFHFGIYTNKNNMKSMKKKNGIKSEFIYLYSDIFENKNFPFTKKTFKLKQF